MRLLGFDISIVVVFRDNSFCNFLINLKRSFVGLDSLGVDCVLEVFNLLPNDAN